MFNHVEIFNVGKIFHSSKINNLREIYNLSENINISKINNFREIHDLSNIINISTNIKLLKRSNLSEIIILCEVFLSKPIMIFFQFVDKTRYSINTHLSMVLV